MSKTEQELIVLKEFFTVCKQVKDELAAEVEEFKRFLKETKLEHRWELWKKNQPNRPVYDIQTKIETRGNNERKT